MKLLNSPLDMRPVFVKVRWPLVAGLATHAVFDARRNAWLTSQQTAASFAMQDLFAGAWQQADPEVDQVPYTFPPADGASKMGRGRKATRGSFRGRGQPRQNSGRAIHGKAQGRGICKHPLAMPPRLPQKSVPFVPPVPATRQRVSAADYAAAIEGEL